MNVPYLPAVSSDEGEGFGKNSQPPPGRPACTLSQDAKVGIIALYGCCREKSQQEEIGTGDGQCISNNLS